MILYTVEENLQNFSAWSGGKTMLDELIKHPRTLRYIEAYLQDVTYYALDLWSDTDINDFLWFDAEPILLDAGFIDEEGNWLEEEE